MLETQGRYQNQERKQENLREAPLADHFDFSISALLPESPNVSGRCTGVARNQIARPDGAGNVGAFRKVLPLVTRGEDTAVTPGRRSTPSAELAALGGYGERPSRVDELDCAPADLVLPEDIDNPYAFISNLNPGKPKEQQGCGGYQANGGKRHQGRSNAFADQNYQPCKRHHHYARESYGSARSGPEYLHTKSLACRREVLS